MAEAQTGAHRRERGQSVARTVGQVEDAGHLPAARHRSGRKVTARAHANLEGGRRAVHRAEAHPRAVAQARA